MTFDEFEARASAEWERIPADYRAGVDGLVVERRAVAHAGLPDVYTLGECVTETYPSEWGGPETTRSLVVLYYGSFFRLAREDPGFDWEGELWETLTHELQHHLESLADDDALIDMDYAADQNFRRGAGEMFDPFFYRAGALENGWYRVEDEYFLETGTDTAAFEWGDVPYRVVLPASPADVVIATVVDGVAGRPPPALHIVRVPARRWHDRLRALFGASPRVEECDVTAERL